MKYENEINKILSGVLPKEVWMTDEDHKESINFALKSVGITRQKLSDEIEAGVKNGHTVKQQMKILNRFLKTL